jgi:signal transduction histidine kinase
VDEVASDLAVLDGAQVPCSGPRVVNELPHDTIVEVDRDQIYRVLAKLGRNAFEAGARNVCIRRGGEAGGTLFVHVVDNGPGLAAVACEQLFRPFKGSARRGGAGLGLVIARDVMRAHGDDLELVETGDDGTTFRLSFPRTG